MSAEEQKYINFLKVADKSQKRIQVYFQLSPEFRQHIHDLVWEGWIGAVPALLQMEPDQQKNIVDFSQLPNARMKDIIGFLQIDPEQKASITDFIQQIDNDEIEQLSRYYGGDYEFYDEKKDHLKNNVYVVSGEHIGSVSPTLNISEQKLIFAPNVKSICTYVCGNATDISFMKGSQFTGFVEPDMIRVKPFRSKKLKRISLANCNELEILESHMFNDCPELQYISISNGTRVIKSDCFNDCPNIMVVIFGLYSRLEEMQDVCLSKCLVCIGPSRFFPKGWFEAMFTPHQRVPLLLKSVVDDKAKRCGRCLNTTKDVREFSPYHAIFEAICAWSPKYGVQAMKANMLPQEEEEAQTKK